MVHIAKILSASVWTVDACIIKEARNGIILTMLSKIIYAKSIKIKQWKNLFIFMENKVCSISYVIHTIKNMYPCFFTDDDIM